MTLKQLLLKNKMSKYALCKKSGVPQSTINDLFSGKTDIEKCNAGTLYNIAQTLGTTVEELILSERYLKQRPSFGLFRSEICHRLKSLGDLPFVLDVIESNDIREYLKREWYPECFYLLAMIDYISRINNVPLCLDYDDIRGMKLEQMLYPAGVLLEFELTHNETVKKEALKEAIPEFLNFNIVEGDVRDVF